MIRVAIETATPFGTVAVARDADVLAEVELGAQRRHAEMALPALEEALEAAGVEREAVQEVVVGSGPGSFTGVRVAGATAKGLVAALGVPLRAFPSLLALAVEARDAADGATPLPGDAGRPVCALLDARRGEVYAGCWRVGEAGVDQLLPPMVAVVSDVLDATRASAPLFAGDGALRYLDALAAAGATVVRAPVHPRASTLLRLAAADPDAGRVADVAGWEPAYVRASSAERGVAG